MIYDTENRSFEVSLHFHYSLDKSALKNKLLHISMIEHLISLILRLKCIDESIIGHWSELYLGQSTMTEYDDIGNIKNW